MKRLKCCFYLFFNLIVFVSSENICPCASFHIIFIDEINRKWKQTSNYFKCICDQQGWSFAQVDTLFMDKFTSKVFSTSTVFATVFAGHINSICLSWDSFHWQVTSTVSFSHMNADTFAASPGQTAEDELAAQPGETVKLLLSCQAGAWKKSTPPCGHCHTPRPSLVKSVRV